MHQKLGFALLSVMRSMQPSNTSVPLLVDRLRAGLLICASGVVLSGCVVIPLPHTVRIAPDIDGVVTAQGKPAAGLRVFLHEHSYERGDGCPASKTLTETDEMGRFHFDEVKELRLLMMMGDPLSTWTVCFAGADGDVVGWRNFTMGYASPKAVLSCELKKAAEQSGGGRGVCRLVGG